MTKNQPAIVERDDVLSAIPAALIAGEHVLLVGSPGTAKSLLARAACQSLDGARYFERLLTRFSTPEEIFGPVSLAGLQQDRYMRITAGMLPEAEIAFLDEIFKSSSAILNSLLTVMNERKFAQNGHTVDCPLVSVFAASNEYPHDRAELGALFDRFLLKFEVKPVADPQNFTSMLQMPDGIPDVLPRTTIPELLQQREEAMQVTFDPQQLFLTLRQKLLEEGIQPSDRTWRKSVRLTQVVAMLRGSTSVDECDLEILQHDCWTDPSQQRACRRVVGAIANPLGARVVEVADLAFELHRDALAAATPEAGAEGNAKLKALTQELQGILGKQSGAARQRTTTTLERVRRQNREVVEKCLGLAIS